MTSHETIALEQLSTQRALRDQLADDVRVGLTGRPMTLPPKYFYDAVGSELFEQITRLEEYYPTRTETAILTASARQLVAAVAPAEIVELGSGSSTKTHLLLDALREEGRGSRYVAVDVSATALASATERLRKQEPWLSVVPYVGDFFTDLSHLPRHGRRLLIFLGSTIGNLEPTDRRTFFREVVRAMEPGDGFLLGADLVKEPEVLIAAYDDRAGVTAAFNRNLLTVLRRELGAEIVEEDFRHEARWNAEYERIEMWLVATVDTMLDFPTLELTVPVAAGKGIRTELSCKFRRVVLENELLAAGLSIERWITDDRGWFSLSLIRLT